MQKEFYILKINDLAEVGVMPIFDPTQKEPKISDLYIFRGYSKLGAVAEFDKAPKWLVDIANNELYEDIMNSYVKMEG